MGELAEASLAGLLGTWAEGYDKDSSEAELAGWLAAHEDRGSAIEELVGAVRSSPFRGRAQAMLTALFRALPSSEGERLLRGLRNDTEPAPLALNLLCQHEVLGTEDLTEQEGLFVGGREPPAVRGALGRPRPGGRRCGGLAGAGAGDGTGRGRTVAPGHPDKTALEELRRLTA